MTPSNGMTSERYAKYVNARIAQDAATIATVTERTTMIDKYNEAGIPASELEYIDGVNLAMTGNATAKPVTPCVYPRCEDCDKYHGHYCTVPMVVSKQKWLLTEAIIVDMRNRLGALEELVTDEILGSDKSRKVDTNTKVNYTWADYSDYTDKEQEDG